jgi:hypothetical protein
MMRGDSEVPNDGCKILQFRQRDAANVDAQRAAAVKNSGRDIDRLLDLAQYENPRGDADDYKHRMVENVAAVVFLFAFIAIAAFGFIDLEQVRSCAATGICWP